MRLPGDSAPGSRSTSCGCRAHGLHPLRPPEPQPPPRRRWRLPPGLSEGSVPEIKYAAGPATTPSRPTIHTTSRSRNRPPGPSLPRPRRCRSTPVGCLPVERPAGFTAGRSTFPSPPLPSPPLAGRHDAPTPIREALTRSCGLTERVRLLAFRVSRGGGPVVMGDNTSTAGQRGSRARVRLSGLPRFTGRPQDPQGQVKRPSARISIFYGLTGSPVGSALGRSSTTSAPHHSGRARERRRCLMRMETPPRHRRLPPTGRQSRAAAALQPAANRLR